MTEKKPKRAYIQTLGCQMNVYDSDRMRGTLAAMGYAPVDSPWKADLVIVNTCAIREKAVQKVFSYVGRLCGIKRRKPRLKIVVAGCVAQQQSDKISARFEGVDLILGTRVLHRLESHIRQIADDHDRVIDVEMPEEFPGATPEAESPFEGPLVEPAGADISRFVTIMRGCDNFCAYCVVPYVRGRETSRNAHRIIAEVETMVQGGAREVTLLGQNVNSYGKKEGYCAFPELLDRINEIRGLERIRFVTSHPKDLSDELIDAFSRIDKLCNHIHLPVQSGSNRILKRMNRKYTRETYMHRVEKLRAVRSDAAITTDFIVGFPGETREDFEATLDLMEKVRFDTLFAFEYSDRPEAPARRFEDKVPPDEKKDRLHALLQRQKAITRQIYENLVGREMTVLVEGFSKRNQQDASCENAARIEMTGRTSENRIVNFDLNGQASKAAAQALIGKIIPVFIERPCANSLKGRLPDNEAAVLDMIKGGKTHAA